MSLFPLVGLIFLMCLLMMFNFIRHYKTGTIEKALVVYGKLDPEDKLHHKILTKGSTFVWPVIQKYYYFWLDDYNIKSTKIYADKNKLKHEISFDLMIRPSTNESELETAVTNSFGKDKSEIIDILRIRIEKLLSKELSDQTVQEVNLKAFLKLLSNKIKAELANYGFSNITMSNVSIDRTNVH